jgi:lysophospholipase L1-like esterase
LRARTRGIARSQIVALTASTALCLGVGYIVLNRGGDGETTEIVDDSAELAERLEARLGTKGEPVRHFPDSTLVREFVTEEDAQHLFPALKRDEAARHVYDPQTYFRYRAGLDYEVKFPEHPEGAYRVKTNSLGLIATHESEPRDVRVLVAGDSHTAGVCSPSEGYPALLEVALGEQLGGRSVEVLNSGVGYYTFYEYLGALEKYLPLGLDALVVVVYGGNDFLESVRLRHWFAHTKQPMPGVDYWAKMSAFEEACNRPKVWVGQSVSQLLYFATFPEEEEASLATGKEVLSEIARICDAEDVHLVVAYLPPMWDVQLERYDGEFPKVRDSLSIGDRAVRGMHPLADALLAHGHALGVETVDLRPAFAAHPGAPYWRSDHHISLEGQRLVAEGVLPPLLRLLQGP